VHVWRIRPDEYCVAETLEKALDRLATLEERVEILTAELEKKQRENHELKLLVDYLQRHRFGPKSERIDPGQLQIPFDDLVEVVEAEHQEQALPEAKEAPDGESPDDRIAPKHRRKGAHGRKSLPANLRREHVEHDLDLEDRTCPCCSKEMARIGELVTEEVDWVPASVIVREHVRPKYACRSCQEGVVNAVLPPRPIEKGRPGPGLLSQILVSKYADHLPLHRQEAIFERQGYSVSRSTMCDWVGRCAELLFPIVQVMREDVIASAVINADETSVLMQINSQGGGKQTCWLWGYVGDKDDVVFDFRLSRSRDGPTDFLLGFAGFLQVDGYAGYNEVCRREDVIKAACWAHARRGFFEALPSATADASNVLAKIQRLYRVEKQGREAGLDVDGLAELRQSRSAPILASILQDLERLAKSTLPRSPLGKAVAYTLNLWEELGHYIHDGRLAIDNTTVERAMRGVAVGRKNWLFCGSQSGGERAAVMYSLVETCKRHGVEPFEYFRDILCRIPTCSDEEIAELTPRAWKQARTEALPATTG